MFVTISLTDLDACSIDVEHSMEDHRSYFITLRFIPRS